MISDKTHDIGDVTN